MKAKHSNTVQSKQTFMKVLIGIAILFCIFIPVTASYAFDDKGEVPEKQENPINDPSKDDADTKEVDKKDETKKIETDSVEKEAAKKEAVKEESNNNVNNGPQTLTVTGNAWGWSTTSGMDFTYNAEKDLYSVNIPADKADGDWKIVKDHSWTVNWGGTISYSDKKGQCRGVNSGSNCSPPAHGESFTIYFKYCYDLIGYIGVNVEPTYSDVIVDISTGQLDAAEKATLASKGWIQPSENLLTKYDCSSQTKKQIMDDWDGIIPTLPGFRFSSFTPTPSGELVNAVTVFYAVYEKEITPGNDLEIVGDFNNWGTDPGSIPLIYDENKQTYSVNVRSSEISGEWKIRAKNDWSFNRGGISLYADTTRQINNAVMDGVNYTFPQLSDFTIILASKDSYLDKVFINTGTNPHVVSIHSQDNKLQFQCILDGPPFVVSDFSQYLPEEDCAEVYMDNVQKDGFDTVALICKDSSGNVKHSGYFKVNNGTEYVYINNKQISHVEDGAGLTNDVTVWVNMLAPVQTTIKATDEGKNFLFKTSNDWMPMRELIFGASNYGQDVTFKQGSEEGIVIIDDGHADDTVQIKSADDSVVLTPDRFIYNKERPEGIFLDYNDRASYSVTSQDKSKGTISPEKNTSFNSFIDEKYKIEGNKITFTLGFRENAYEAKALDGYKFDGWVDANGNKITKTDGNIGEIADFNASFVPDKTAPSGDDFGHVDNVSGSADTGDNTPFVALIACVCGCALLLKKRHVKQ
ncbi:MAG: hypothetical protein Q4E88_01240 [Coriobacteriia bacterium]|nr:hypothetical protein [Coriobacteriia bacterium]